MCHWSVNTATLRHGHKPSRKGPTTAGIRTTEAPIASEEVLPVPVILICDVLGIVLQTTAAVVRAVSK